MNKLIEINEFVEFDENFQDIKCEKKRREFSSILFTEEFKELIYKQMITAQDADSPFYLGKLRSYEIYHKPLSDYFINLYGKKPSQTDNLAFVLLLTYPKKKVERLKNLSELKLAFNNKLEESDFEPHSYHYGEETCICNECINHIYIFKNMFSGININLGSICNKRYGLISKKDKRLCKLIKEHKEKERERAENLPEGYFENKRNNNIILKEENKQINMELKLMKQEDKRIKSIDKVIKAELKEFNKSGFKIYINKNCYFCKRDGIYKSTDKICICSTCSPSNNKLLKQNINSEIKKALEDCLNCDLPFINTSKESCELCRICKKIVKINNCKMCKSQFILGINKNDNYCDVCDENLINCFDCKRELLKQQSQNLRCYKCNNRHINNLILKTCQYCDIEIEVSEKDKWRTCCRNCYVNNISLQKCNSCDDMFKKLPHESWKKTCTTCYYKIKHKLN